MDVQLSSQRLRTPIRRNKLSQARTHVFAVSIQCTRACPLTSYLVPTNCSTPFWDAIGGKCICSSNTCQFEDNSRPIGPNGANQTGRWQNGRLFRQWDIVIDAL
ncbi:hypothetical protein K443DRAFT_678970 [Laccaria amethystina LaAM-08-1]|uniref:Uncharacterized protein n=1 Tax=Laccaria amethystina LaAM-08-1 TaxID=1095629 RepID=A0A0C9XY34_9AGAR|nr:hypothetical protein K443DRAFT_678970 [Laccaria amethystina LaAM-08-1]